MLRRNEATSTSSQFNMTKRSIKHGKSFTLPSNRISTFCRLLLLSMGQDPQSFRLIILNFQFLLKPNVFVIKSHEYFIRVSCMFCHLYLLGRFQLPQPKTPPKFRRQAFNDKSPNKYQ